MNKVFSVWADTKNGDLMTFGTSPGRALSREQAWEKVKELRGLTDDFKISYIRVFRGSTRVYAEVV